MTQIVSLGGATPGIAGAAPPPGSVIETRRPSCVKGASLAVPQPSARLRQLLEKDGAGSAEEVRELILSEVHRFVGAAPQHDDMTMVVLRID